MQILTLYERRSQADGLLTAELERLYGGNLVFPDTKGRPYVIGNFVETLDGVVSFLIPGKSGGSPISGSSAEDHFVMGLLRSVADAVLIGSGTLRGDPGRVRIPELIYDAGKDLYGALRRKLGKPPLPVNVILTASGNVDLAEPTFHTEGLRAVIVTTEEGMARIGSERGGASHVDVRSTGERGSSTSPGKVLKMLHDEFQVKLLLHEGGPTVFGEFLAADMVDELFLTIAPQVAGRSKDAQRPSVAGESLFLPETAPWFSLASVKRGSSALLLRYVSSR